MSEGEAAKYLATEAKRMRVLVEIDLHRLEESALNTLKQHGLKVKRSKRYVSIASSGPSGKGGYGVGGTNDPRFIFRNILARAKDKAVLDKKRLCRFTYDIDQMREVAYKILRNRKAALTDIAAAVVALDVEQLWIDYSLSNAQTLWFTLGLLKATSMVPTEETRQQLISDRAKKMREAQDEPFDKLRKYVQRNAKTSYREDRTSGAVQRLGKHFHEKADEAFLEFYKIPIGKKPKLKWFRNAVREVLPAGANKAGRPRTRTQ